MFTNGTTLTNLDIKLAIIRHPLILSPEALVTDVIAEMSRDFGSCEVFSGVDAELNPTDHLVNLNHPSNRDLQLEARFSCVLISDGNNLLGIFTKRDVVRLIAQQCPLANLRLCDVMTPKVIALPEAEFTDLFVATHLLQKHRIRHLPIIGADGRVSGIITHDSLCQVARPIDLLRLRQAKEVMTKEVIWTTSDTTILGITQLMHHHRVGSVVIAMTQCVSESIREESAISENQEAAQLGSGTSSVIPLGVITERDLVQFQALGLSVHEYTAAQIMSTPAFTVLPQDHLWTVQQTMTRHMIRRVIVVEQDQSLAGIVTQTSLLQILNPLELYNLAEILEDKVNELEAEKVKILARRTEELEKEVQERTQKLTQTLEREKIINQAAQRIRNSLDLQEILNTCVNEVRDFLNCDRVIVYECEASNSGYIIAEAVVPPFTALVGCHINNNYCQKEVMESLVHEQQFIVNDIDAPEYPLEQVAFFNQYQVKASLITQIRLDGKIWGLLVAQECRSSRHWLNEEAQLLATLAIQLSIGIRQSFAYTTMAQQVQELTLWRKRYEVAETTSGQVLYEYNHTTDQITWGTTLENVFGYQPETAPQNIASYLALVHPDDVESLAQAAEIAFHQKTNLHQKYRLLHRRGEYIWIEGWGRWLVTPDGEAVMMIGMLSNIHEQKLKEESLKIHRDFNQLIAQITSRFVYLSDEDLDQEINQTLSLIGDAIKADIAYIFRTNLELTADQLTHKWNKYPDSTYSLSQDLAIVLGPWCENLLSSQAVCHIPDMHTACDELQTAMHHWHELQLELQLKHSLQNHSRNHSQDNLQDNSQNNLQNNLKENFREPLRGILLIPLLAHNQVIGHIGFGAFTHPIELDQEMINLIVVTGQTIANAQERVSNRWELEMLNQHLEIEITRRINQFQEVYSLQQAILNSFDYAITSTDLNGTIRTFNAGAEKLLGYSADEVIGKATPMLFHDPQEIIDYAAFLSATLGRVIEPGIEVFTTRIVDLETEKEWTNIRKDGSRFLMSLSMMPLKDLNDQTIGLVGIGKDVTAKKRIAEALERSENRLKRLFDANVVGIMFTDFGGGITDANDYFLNLIGYTREDLNSGRINWNDLTPLYQRHKDFQAVTQLQLHHAVAPWEKTYYHREGYEIPILIGVALLEDPINGQDIERGNCVCIVIDITEQKHSENRLRETQQFITTIINTIPLPVFWKDCQAKFLGCNLPLAQILDLDSPDAIIGKTDIELNLNIESGDTICNSDQMVINSGNPLLGISETLVLPDGQKRYIEAHKAPLRDWQGEIIGIVGMFQDITQRKIDEETLRLNEEFFRNAFNNTTVGMCLVSISGQFLKVNHAFSRFVGYTPQQLQTITFHDITHSEDLQADIILRQNLLDGTSPSYYTEKRYITKSGTIVWALLSVSLVKSLADEPLYFVAQIQDITEQKEALTNLQASESRFRQIFESKVVGMLISDFQGNIINTNDRFLEIIGYTRADFETKRIRWDLITPLEYRESDLNAMNRLRNHGVINPWEKEYYRKDGSRVPILLGAALLPDSTDQTVCVVIDISDRKAIERALQNSEDRFRQLAQAIDVVFWIMSLDRGSWVYVSPAYDKIWGRKYIELYTTTHNWLDSIHPEDRERVVAALPQQINGDFNQEYRIIRPDGEIRWIHDRAFPMQREGSQTYLIAGVAEDITERKAWESQLQHTNNELARATRLKDEFLANMSHELRTPLNAILGMAEGLQDHVFGQLTEAQTKSIETIERSGTHLLALINDILDLAKIESGQTELSLDLCTVPVLIQSSLGFIRQQARKKQLEITVTIPDQLPCVMVDQLRIHQVLINLLNNAVKFTPAGGKITIAVEYPCPSLVSRAKVSSRPDSLADSGTNISKPNVGENLELNTILNSVQETNFVRISVIDTGIGIAPENLHKLFQPFVQIDSALNRQYEGTGLGLAVVKRLVELHGGHVTVASQAGQGSCFTFDLPCAQSNVILDSTAKEIFKVSDPQITVTPKLILLVEDNNTVVHTISSYLKAKNYQVIIADNGIEALEILTTERPDVILMDIQMPVMDGLETIRRIKMNPNLAIIPIIALTALAMEGDQAQCLTVGATEYMSKPVKMKELVNAIERVFHNAYTR